MQLAGTARARAPHTITVRRTSGAKRARRGSRSASRIERATRGERPTGGCPRGSKRAFVRSGRDDASQARVSCDASMNFDFDESHVLLRKSVREFARAEIAPYAVAWDSEERFPLELVPKLASMGLLGIRIPEEYGGSGMDTQAYALSIEEIARVDGSIALTVASHNGLGTGHLLAFGTEAQKRRYLPMAASGESLAAWALTEPGSGSDAAALRTTARRDGTDWILNGSKTFITQGSVCGFCGVLARTNPDVPNRSGITAFIVDRGTPGFTASKHLRKLGCRASDTAEIVLDEVRVSDSQRLGDVDRGFADTMRILDRGRISIAAMALG